METCYILESKLGLSNSISPFGDTKGVFFSKSAMCLSNIQKQIFQITILNLKFI